MTLHARSSMHRRFALIISFALSFAIVTAAVARPWARHAYPELGFAIDLPGEPKWEESIRHTGVGDAEMRIGVVDQGKAGMLMVAVGAYPAVLSDVQLRLDEAVKGAADNVQGRVVSMTAIEVDGAPGREVIIERPGMIIVKARMVLRGRQLYQAAGAGTGAAGLPADTDRMLASFHLLP